LEAILGWGLLGAYENITPEYIKMIENKLNNRPRKSLNWRTPNEVFYGLEVAV
jgi:IS30 family transposase